MRYVLRFFLLSLALLSSGFVFALLPTVTQFSPSNITPAVWYDSGDAACTASLAAKNVSPPAGYHYEAGSPFVQTGGGVPNGCGIKFMNGTVFYGNADTSLVNRSGVCPANSSAVAGGCQCNATYDESGGQCVPHTNQCTAKTGVVGVTNWTQGYSRTPDEGDTYGVGPVSPPPASGNTCDGGCTVSLQTSGPGVNYYVSQSPTANGLYRRSVDYPNIGLGTECTVGTADAPAQKSTPPPPCPGAVGEINGRTVCVGTASAPVTTTPIDRPSAVPVAGNPAAGAKPPTGEGSGSGSAGRTPSTGNGSATGGPAAAGVGGKGGGAGGTATGAGVGGSASGSTPTDQKPDPCGAPGQPVCAVKVDETGTPSGVGTTFQTANTQLDTNKTTVETAIAAAHQQAAPTWSFTFALPTGCTPYQTQIKGFVLNPCAYQSTIHDLMSMIWAAVTLFTITGMVGRTIRES
jgi:hypothetical protein